MTPRPLSVSVLLVRVLFGYVCYQYIKRLSIDPGHCILLYAVACFFIAP